jgi:hypothetical protein
MNENDIAATLAGTFGAAETSEEGELAFLRARYYGHFNPFEFIPALGGLIKRGGEPLIRLCEAAGRKVSSVDEARTFLDGVQKLCFASFVPHDVKLKTADDYAEEMRRVIRAEGKPLAAIEAVWDGDTNGWFVVMELVFTGPSPQHARFTSKGAVWLRGGGGDTRLFNGVVPPWPEAALAKEIGATLSKEYGVPFHFASPDQPDDDAPRWWTTSC